MKTGYESADRWLKLSNKERLKMDRQCMPSEWSEYKLLTILKDRVQDNIDRYEKRLLDCDMIHSEPINMIIYMSIESRKYLKYLKYKLWRLKKYGQ